MRNLVTAFPLACMGALGALYACGSSSPSTPASSNDAAASDSTATEAGAGDELSAEASPEASVGDAGQPGADADAGVSQEASCVARPDAGVTTIDAGSPIVFFDVGAGDLRLDLTSDGKLAMIEDSPTGDVYLYDTATGALAKQTNVAGDPSTVQATSISGSGNRISALHGASSIVAGVWDSCAASWMDLANTNPAGCMGPPDNESAAFDLSKDGSVVVGDVWTSSCTVDAMLWTEASSAWTPTALQHLGMAGGNNRATVVSDDGTVIGGFAQQPAADRSPAVWTSSGTGQLLDPTGQVTGEVMAVSPDGKMVAGQWNTVTDAGDADNTSFAWTQTGGLVLVGTLPNPQSQDFVWPLAIAANDALILGSAGDPSWANDLNGTEEFAVAWTKAAGMRKLQDIVAAQHITLPAGYDLTGIDAASADGTVILGFATDMNDPNLAQHTFVLRMPVSAYGL